MRAAGVQEAHRLSDERSLYHRITFDRGILGHSQYRDMENWIQAFKGYYQVAVHKSEIERLSVLS